MTDAPRTLIDPATGRPILMAPVRRHRPLLTAADADAAHCPFCPGAEHETPPEIDAVRAPGTAADAPGWHVRAFANLYPAATVHEVIAEGAVHTTQPAQLDASLWADALTLYRRRIIAIERDAATPCAFWFKNIGLRAGASIAHNHSQILGLPMLPPRLQLELERAGDSDRCLQCEEIEHATAEGRVVLASSDHLVISPRCPKLPFETWLLPRRHDDDFLAPGAPDDLAWTLHAWFVAVDRAFAAPPFNIWLHRVAGADFHWHFELQPRTGNLAGLELGGDMYINSVTASDAARRLRQP